LKYIWTIVIPAVMFFIVKLLVKCYTALMMRVDVVRQALLPAGPKIIAVNHPSVMDPFVVANVLKKRSFILITGYVFEMALAGRLLRKLGHIPVVAGSGQKAVEHALALLKSGQTVVIFPEGQISPKDGFAPAHTGVARLALESGAPVVPVGIHLMDKYVKRFVMNYRDHAEDSALYFKGPYFLTVGEARRCEGDVNDRELVRATTESIMEDIKHLAFASEKRMNRAVRALALYPSWQSIFRMRARI